MERKNKIKGSLIGGAIGDALGYQIEFKRGIKEKEVQNFKNNIGIISDDTQMSLFTANAILYRDSLDKIKGISLQYDDVIYESYLDWLDTQFNHHNHNSISWIKDIDRLNVARAPGNTCISALMSGTKGTLEKSINNSKGCGGIMRVAPIGLYMETKEEAGVLAAKASAITHGHPLGIIPAYVFSVLLWYLTNTNLSINESLDKTIELYEKDFDIYDSEYKDYFLELVDKAKKLAKKQKSDIDAIKELGEGWVAEETFAIAIYSCLKYKDSFEDAVICSINHDGDSDSTGSVTGNIMGAYLGYDAIPNKFKDNIEIKDVILELSSYLSKEIPINEYFSNKYLYAKNKKLKKE